MHYGSVKEEEAMVDMKRIKKEKVQKKGGRGKKEEEK